MAQGKKTGGRLPGSKNKISTELRNWVEELLDENRALLKSDFKKLNARDRLYLAEKLMKFVLPTMASVSTTLDFENLSDEQLDFIISELKK